MTVELKDHPAKFSPEVLEALKESIGELVPKGATILDPFAGVGLIHVLYPEYNTLGVEIEPEWAHHHERTRVGDSTLLTHYYQEGSIDAIVTSAAYANRMADNYAGDAKGSKRYTYRTSLGRELHANNGAKYNWGTKYKELHIAVWKQCYEVLADGGLFFLNISNHIRKHEEVAVVEWHIEQLLRQGFFFEEMFPVGTKRMRHGRNHAARVTSEKIAIFRK